MSQEPTGQETTPGLSRSRYSIVNPLIAKAKVADTEKGAADYAAALTDLVVSDRPGKGYVKRFARRLAKADLAARRGDQRWVPESVIVKAFNELMEQVASSPAQLIKTDVSVVHRLRYSLYNTSPYLSTVPFHEDKCLPSEAMFVIALLLWNNGAVSRPLPGPLPALQPSGRGYVISSAPSGPNAQLIVSGYTTRHKRSQVVELYDALARHIGL